MHRCGEESQILQQHPQTNSTPHRLWPPLAGPCIFAVYISVAPSHHSHGRTTDGNRRAIHDSHQKCPLSFCRTGVPPRRVVVIFKSSQSSRAPVLVTAASFPSDKAVESLARSLGQILRHFRSNLFHRETAKCVARMFERVAVGSHWYIEDTRVQRDRSYGGGVGGVVVVEDEATGREETTASNGENQERNMWANGCIVAWNQMKRRTKRGYEQCLGLFGVRRAGVGARYLEVVASLTNNNLGTKTAHQERSAGVLLRCSSSPTQKQTQHKKKLHFHRDLRVEYHACVFPCTSDSSPTVNGVNRSEA